MKNEKIQHLNLGEVIYDTSYMVRNINSHVINRYASNMLAGAVFPPLILDAKTNKLVCGFHRYEAYTKNYDMDYKVPVILRNFSNEKEILAEALSDNSRHGLPLTKKEIRQAIYKGKKYKLSMQEIANILNLKVENIEKWGKETVVVIKPTGEKEEKPAKGKANTYSSEMTEETYNEVMDKGSGWNLSFHVNQIITNLKNEAYVLDDKNIEILENLVNTIKEILKGV